MTDRTDNQIPDIYSDLFNILENPLGVMVVLTKSEPPMPGQTGGTQRAKQVAVLRFSPENWKVILMVGRKQLRARETTQGVPIKIAAELLTSLNLTEADW